MTDSSATDRWAFAKVQGPTLAMVASFVGFMNARNAAQAAIFGMLGVIVLAWVIRRGKRLPAGTGVPVFHLGRMTAVGTPHMSGWYKLAVVAFALLGFVNFFVAENASLPTRLGMALICFAIVGAFLILCDERLRDYGGFVFAMGFVLSGLMFTWATVLALQSGEKDAYLHAVKQAVLAAFVLLAGVSALRNMFRSRGITPIYESGIPGTHGFVTWSAAESLRLVETDRVPSLRVGAYGGWTLFIDVPEDQLGNVKSLIERKRVDPLPRI